MEEHEVPLDIYTHDLLGMEKSSWHRVDQPKEESSKPTPLNSKQKYITILLCVSFLYFVALGVWTIQQKVFPPNMAEVNEKVFFPLVEPNSVDAEDIDALKPQTDRFFLGETYDYYHYTYPAFTEIDDHKAIKLDQRKMRRIQIPNWIPFYIDNSSSPVLYIPTCP